MSSDRPAWRRANDALEAERAVSAVFDPVTGALNFRSLRRFVGQALGSGETVLVAAVAVTPENSGRFTGRDAQDRRLARAMRMWGAELGLEVFWLADGLALAVGLGGGREVAALEGAVLELGAFLAREGLMAHRMSHVSGPAAHAVDLLLQARQSLLLPPAAVARAETSRPAGGLPLVEQLWTMDGVAAMHVRQPPTSDLDPEQAWRLAAVARARAECAPPTGLDTPLPRSGGGPEPAVIWDATPLLSSAWRAPVRTLSAIERLPRSASLGLDAWAAAEAEDFAGLCEVLRALGRRVVLTSYGNGREPVAPLDELPVDALALDRSLERGALTSRADRALRWALADRARRAGLPVYTAMRPNDAEELIPTGTAEDVPLTEHVAQVLVDGWRARLTPVETALLVNGRRPEGGGIPRMSRYDVALAWAAMGVADGRPSPRPVV